MNFRSKLSQCHSFTQLRIATRSFTQLSSDLNISAVLFQLKQVYYSHLDIQVFLPTQANLCYRASLYCLLATLNKFYKLINDRRPTTVRVIIGEVVWILFHKVKEESPSVSRDRLLFFHVFRPLAPEFPSFGHLKHIPHCDCFFDAF